MAKPEGRKHIQFERNAGWVEKASGLAEAIKVVVAGLGELDFEDKRRVLRLVADVHMIDPSKL